MMNSSDAKIGVSSGLGAYFLWGILPVYWKLLSSIPAIDILCYRFIWCLVFLAVLYLIIPKWRRIFFDEAKAIFSDYKQVLFVIAASILIAANWGTYIWTVIAGRTAEVSLGYFINPLVNFLLAFIFLKERLSKAGIVACLLALAGVVVITAHEGALPWPALILPLTFGFYGLFKKKLTLTTYSSLSIETLLPMPFAVLYLLIFSQAGFMGNGLSIDLLSVGAGIITAIPLLLFGTAAKRISYVTIGFIQYLSPTMNFFLAIFIFGEPLSLFRLLGFILIWVGVIVYTAGSVIESRHSAKTAS